LIALAYLGVLGTVAFLVWQEGMRLVQATASSILLLVEILVAYAISAAFLGERLGTWGLVGAAGILAGAFLAGRSPTVTPSRTAASPGETL
jgi:drug/metabolite transporter (DMT)-like permease